MQSHIYTHNNRTTGKTSRQQREPCGEADKPKELGAAASALIQAARAVGDLTTSGRWGEMRCTNSSDILLLVEGGDGRIVLGSCPLSNEIQRTTTDANGKTQEASSTCEFSNPPGEWNP